jgi:hypothetical protein
MIRSGTPQSVAMSISGHHAASMFARYNITDESDQRQALLNGQSYNAAAASPVSTKGERLPAPKRKQFSREPRIECAQGA